MQRTRVLLSALILGAIVLSLPGGRAQPAESVRLPAVAGLFYPRDPAELSETIAGLLAAAPAAPTPAGELRALIVPHAGYTYSGLVAASGFRLLRGTRFPTVVLLAPSHYALLATGSIPAASRYRTPLGDVRVSAKARQLAAVRPFALDPPCEVRRPAWAAQSSRPLPPDGADRADTWEHAGEVEVPFLQQTLGRFELLPVVMGEVDPAAAARALEPMLDEHTLVVVCSDLSHFHRSNDARALDAACVDASCTLDVAKMSRQEACGRIPILTLLHIARARGWRPVLLDARNSGDVTGDISRVVGYAAIAFYRPTPAADSRSVAAAGGLSPADRRTLLALARQTLRTAAATGQEPAVRATEFSPALQEPRGCFVTLTIDGALRGCVGHLGATQPVYRDVIDSARNAALFDSRFRPVAPREVDRIRIEISLLGPPRPLAFSSPEDLLAKLHPPDDGVILQLDGRSATYLPQVWEQIPDKVTFLDTLSEKAGARAGDWRRPGTRVSIYHVEAFQDSTPSRE